MGRKQSSTITYAVCSAQGRRSGFDIFEITGHVAGVSCVRLSLRAIGWVRDATQIDGHLARLEADPGVAGPAPGGHLDETSET